MKVSTGSEDMEQNLIRALELFNHLTTLFTFMFWVVDIYGFIKSGLLAAGSSAIKCRHKFGLSISSAKYFFHKVPLYCQQLIST